MPIVFWMSRLKPGVEAVDYEKWLREFDYVNAAKLSSILSYRTHRIHGPFLDEGQKPFDYLEVIEVTDLDEYRRQLEDHPAAQAIATEWGDYVELVHSLTGEFIPPGVTQS